MKVLVVSTDSARRPSYGYRLKSALLAHGHSVCRFNYRALQLHRVTAGRTLLGKLLLAHAKRERPDLTIVAKGESIPPGVIQQLSRLGTTTACWTLDSPFGDGNPFNRLANIKEYDFFFCFDGSYIRQLQKINPNSFFLPCAADPALHREVIPPAERTEKYPITFVGSSHPNRIETLSHLSDLDLSIWGHRWWRDTKGLPLHRNVMRTVYQADRNNQDLLETCRIWNESKINLNIHFQHSRWHPNLRAFELLATRSFELSDDLPHMDDLYKVDKEIATYTSMNDCRRKIEYFLESPEERMKIATAGMKKTLEKHTFYHRMKTLLKTVRM